MSTAPRVVILTVSDRCSRGETVDTSAPRSRMPNVFRMTWARWLNSFRNGQKKLAEST